MAAKHVYRKGFLLLLFNFISTAALEKRFSDFKRCADEECSMLLCRGKAVEDFSGPDCRFLSFKKSETVYVYYKLSGRRDDIWAGSVGNNFGYFRKDLLAVNHVYTEKEHEVPAEETDFVCFDTGFDRFDNYDVDSLLGPSDEENDYENKEASEQIEEAEGAQEAAALSEEEVIDSETLTEPYNSEDLGLVPEDQSASSPSVAELLYTEEGDPDFAATPDGTERAAEDKENVQHAAVDSILGPVDLTKNDTKDKPTEREAESPIKNDFASENEPVSNSEGQQISELKTTFGSMFDAVATDAETTRKTTPYDGEEEESEGVEDHHQDHSDFEAETPLLSFSEEPAEPPASISVEEREEHDDESKPGAEKGMWKTLGDAVFSVVTGGERTEDLSSEEDEDDEEDAVPETPLTFEEAKPDTVQRDPENVVPDLPYSTSVPDEKNTQESEKLLFLPEDDEPLDEMPKLPKEPIFDPKDQQSDAEKENAPEDKEEELTKDEGYRQDGSVIVERDLEEVEDENNTIVGEELDARTETHQDLSKDERPSQDSVIKDEETREDDVPLDQELESSNSRSNVSVEEPPFHEDFPSDEGEDERYMGIDEETREDMEELLEDENAHSFSQPENTAEPSPQSSQPIVSVPEPEYSDDVMRLTLLQSHFTEEKMEQFQTFLGLKNLYKVEYMFSDLDANLRATRLSQGGTNQDIENALESILEASENAILDDVEKMLDNRDKKYYAEHHMDTSTLDEETEILDDFQELAFSLRQKYSTASDSTPLASQNDQDAHELNVKEDMPYSAEDKEVPAVVGDDNLTAVGEEEGPAMIEEEQIVLEEVRNRRDVSVEEDGGHFNKNEDNQPNFSPSDELQKVPQATLDYTLDVGLGVEVERSPSGSLDSIEPLSEFPEEEAGFFSTGIVYTACIISMLKTKVAAWMIVMISLLPEEWKPGETFFGCPWQAVVITALVGVVTFTLFFWRTVLAVKKREYLVDGKRLTDKIQALKKEKNDVLNKMTELQKQTEHLRENQKQSAETVSSTMKKMQELENKIFEAETQNGKIAEEKRTYAKKLEEERENSSKNETRIHKLEKSNEKLQLSRKKIQEAFAKTSVLLDEAKIREDARNVQHKCLEKEYAALKEENKNLKATIKSWEDKHTELSEQIKVYQKSQKELEDSVVLKDHNVEVLSELLADLDACELQKGDAKMLANGDAASDKKTTIKNRIKQMMDVSRVQTTLSVIEEERDRFMTKLLNEEKTRKALEENHRELEHAIGALKSEKGQVENQFKVLQQKNEIMVEMYQQKENALQQRLTKEELERRSKENLLTEVGGKAVEAEEQVKVLRQRINEMEEQMRKTEEVYKEQIKEQENKTHSNWVNARNAERALNQEKLESSKLREKLAVLTSQLNERRAPLFRPNSGQAAGLRQGDSYGPSPVSGGAPSPPLMIEGPRRPPSAPVGRRIDPYGPRPPSDPHGRYADNKHISGMDMSGPRSSSPANMDGSTQAVLPQIKAETEAEASTESPEPGPGSFLASPIRDSPGPMIPGPPHGPGLHDPLFPPGPHGRLPPGGPYRPPGPGLYHPPPHGPPNVPPHGPPLPANGHPGMPLPGPMGGEFGPRPINGHSFPPRPGPDRVVDPRGPPPPHFRPPPPHHFGPMPPLPGVRGFMGPRPPIPPDMRFPGPREHSGPAMDLPPGVPPHSAHGYGRAPPDTLQNSAGAPSGSGQDLKQEASQDSARRAMVEP
ncbi:transport and Golgi organization protein 1 homolog [Aulostomus maculatus]